MQKHGMAQGLSQGSNSLKNESQVPEWCYLDAQEDVLPEISNQVPVSRHRRAVVHRAGKLKKAHCVLAETVLSFKACAIPTCARTRSFWKSRSIAAASWRPAEPFQAMPAPTCLAARDLEQIFDRIATGRVS